MKVNSRHTFFTASATVLAISQVWIPQQVAMHKFAQVEVTQQVPQPNSQLKFSVTV